MHSALPLKEKSERRESECLSLQYRFSTAEERFLFLSRPESMMQNYFL